MKSDPPLLTPLSRFEAAMGAIVDIHESVAKAAFIRNLTREITTNCRANRARAVEADKLLEKYRGLIPEAKKQEFFRAVAELLFFVEQGGKSVPLSTFLGRPKVKKREKS